MSSSYIETHKTALMFAGLYVLVFGLCFVHPIFVYVLFGYIGAFMFRSIDMITSKKPELPKPSQQPELPVQDGNKPQA